VYSVLSFIAAQEPVRTTRVRDSLGIAPQSASALMQYLKRKGLVEKSGEGRVAPYRLTRAGHDTLRDLARRRRP
jgi:Mn-dependent DtxR family transcriptional regulator